MLSVLFSFSAVQTTLARLVTDRINEQYGTDIHIERVDLSSIRKIKLRDVLILDQWRGVEIQGRRTVEPRRLAGPAPAPAAERRPT